MPLEPEQTALRLHDSALNTGEIERDAALRRKWQALVSERLPAVAVERQWPIALDHCFARVLLDNALDAPWRTKVKPPAWRHTPRQDLERAVALGEAALCGEADMATLNARSLALRGKSGALGSASRTAGTKGEGRAPRR